ncbi:MAG: hypothetical protein K8R67_10085 [Desulfobacteraceae bacterium]|nr:hypothetical protein [Desulfobacteraceae bacterium]
MKKIKTALFLIIIIFFAVIIYQNKEYFFTNYSLIIDLKFASLQWVIPEFMNIGYFGIFFCLGFLVAGYMGISSKLKSRKIVRRLNYDINSYHEQISSLKTELDKFKNDPYINNKLESDGDKSPEQPQTT